MTPLGRTVYAMRGYHLGISENPSLFFWATAIIYVPAAPESNSPRILVSIKTYAVRVSGSMTSTEAFTLDEDSRYFELSFPQWKA